MSLTAPRLRRYRLPLRRPWASGRGTLHERSGWLVSVYDEAGRTGVGDCAPLPAAGTETEAEAEAWLEGLGRAWTDPETALAALEAWGNAPPAARAALETALLDLVAQRAGRPLAALLEPSFCSSVAVNAAAGRLDDGLSARLAATVRAGYTVHKVKVGVAPVAEELAALSAAAAVLPPGHRLRFDANGAWDEAEAGRFLEGLAGLPVESLEEPLGCFDPDAFARLQDRAPCPLALDESLPAADLEAVLASPRPGRVVLKAAVLGGPRRALAVARRAHAAGWRAVVTTTLESAVGSWAAVHLAAAVAGLTGDHDLAHGLATADWLAQDLASPPEVAANRIALPEGPGLGIPIRT